MAFGGFNIVNAIEMYNEVGKSPSYSTFSIYYPTILLDSLITFEEKERKKECERERNEERQSCS